MDRIVLTLLIAAATIAAGLPASAATGDIRINEFQASNGTTLDDEDGESQDWI
jgi:hypothetical protein